MPQCASQMRQKVTTCSRAIQGRCYGRNRRPRGHCGCARSGLVSGHMTAPTPAGASDLTRRQALQAGGTAAATAIVFLHPWTSAVARAADGSDSVPKHLLRSSWRDLTDPGLRVGDARLRLESVGDLPAAPNVASLVDIEVGSGGDGHYVAVVNRVLSNRESRRTPPRPPRAAPAADLPVDEGHDTRTGAPESAGASGHRRKVKRRNKVIRSVEVRRTKHGAKCVVELARPRQVSELSAWLKRDDRIVAAAARRVHGKRVAFNLKVSKKRLRTGVYEVTVIALAEDGDQNARNVRVRLR